uniref:DUF7083 domain-containing protein n=2 Tax=Caenorhabditis japonica TaxID=281687 RepID=A0A8R1EAA8_CAEJA
MPRDITTGDQELAMADLTKQISTLVAALSKLTQVGTASEHQGTDTTKLADAISSRIPMFVYEPEDGRTFDSWYSRYKDTITKDGFSLQDDVRPRLVISKLDTRQYSHYANRILPK